MKSDEKGHPCPCCGCLTRSEPDYGTFEICPICNWEDELKQAYAAANKDIAQQESMDEWKETCTRWI